MRWAVVVVVLAGCRIGFDDAGGPLTVGDGGGSNNAPDAGQITTIPVDAAPGTLIPTLVADSYLMGTDNSPNGAEVFVNCGRNSGNGANMWGVWRFDLTSLPQQAVSNATLRLYQYSSVGTTTIAYEIYRITQTWDEASVDWTHASTGVTWPGGGAISTNTYATANVVLGTNGYYDWDVTTLANEWLTGAQPNDGLLMAYVSQPPPGSYAFFASNNHATAAWHAQLLITP
ncbi:MAG TPA: DNRLRE domain-containing protein [Kofleriaceae bacterium]|nr:DNRLRE domain-containing protein [Kofleriaceae bacterium]